MADRKTSVIWSYFIVTEDSKFARCKICKHEVSRGGKTTKTFTTSNLVSHLKHKHGPEYKQYLEEKSRTKDQDRSKDMASYNEPKQLTLAESCDRTRLWDINDPRSHRIHQRIGEMIAIDYQPLSVVDDQGFKSLLKALEPRYSLPSRRYMTENIIPRIHDGIVSKVKEKISNIKWFSFTTDIWSTEVSEESMISLTAHWLTQDFVRKSAVLNVQPFPESHTGENICVVFSGMLLKWSIDRKVCMW